MEARISRAPRRVDAVDAGSDAHDVEVDLLERRPFDPDLDDLAAGRDERPDDRRRDRFGIRGIDPEGAIARVDAPDAAQAAERGDDVGGRARGQPDRQALRAQGRAQPGGRVDPHEAGPDERDAVAQPVGLVEIVRGEDDGAARRAQLLDRLADDEHGLRVERRGGFVEEHDGRIVEQGARDRELLLHALAERAGHLVPPIPQAEEPEIALDALGPDRGVQAVEPPEEIEVGDGRQLVVQARRLGQDADPRPDRIGLGADVEAIDRGRAFGRLDERREQPDGRRLARAVGAEQAEELASVDLEVDAADRPAVAESPPEVDGAQRDRARGRVRSGGHRRSLAGIAAGRRLTGTARPLAYRRKPRAIPSAP